MKTLVRSCLILSLMAGLATADPYRPYRAIAQLKVAGHSGSGALIARGNGLGLVLSCRHVAVASGTPVTLTWSWAKGQPTVQGYTWMTVPGHGFDTDLALIVCRDPVTPPVVRVRKFDSRYGPWTAAGFRSGAMRIVRSGVSKYRADGMVVLFRPFIGGMSGGPLLDARGSIVGVVVASDRKTIGLSSDGNALEQLLRYGFRGSYPMSSPTFD